MDGDVAASSILVDPKHLHGIADCKELPRCSWITKFVLLIGIYHNVSPELIIGSQGPLGEGKVAIQIT